MNNAEKISVTVVREQMRQRIEDAERLEAMRARIRHSIVDPRPSLTLEEAEAELARFMESEVARSPDAAR